MARAIIIIIITIGVVVVRPTHRLEGGLPTAQYYSTIILSLSRGQHNNIVM